MTLWLVDGYNVLRVSLSSGSSPEAAGEPPWWSRERREMLQTLAHGLDEPATEVWLVFDARHLDAGQLQEARSPDAATDGAGRTSPVVRALFAPSADEWIVRAVRDEAGRWAAIHVVTADRPLADRARSRGAVAVSTAEFVERCGGRPPDR